MTLIVTPRNKREERVLKSFLNSLSIRYHSEAEEEAALIKAMQQGRKTPLLNKSEKSAFIRNLKLTK